MFYILRKSLNVRFSFIIRKCKDEDIELMNKWKRQDNFQPGIYDFKAFQKINNFQFWTGTLQNQPIAFFGSAQYDQNLAHLASFYVKRQHRGKGFGMKLWNHVLSQVTAKNIGLNAVMKQQKNYANHGFKTEGILTRYILTERFKKDKSKNLIDCNKVDINILKDYDNKYFPAERTSFLQTWINLPQSKAIAYVKNNNVYGYGVLRPTNSDYKLGPLYAQTNEIASQILCKLTEQIPYENKIVLDSPKRNENMQQLVKQLKMKQSFSFVRMFLNGQPQIFRKHSIYAITTAEFG